MDEECQPKFPWCAKCRERQRPAPRCDPGSSQEVCWFDKFRKKDKGRCDERKSTPCEGNNVKSTSPCEEAGKGTSRKKDGTSKKTTRKNCKGNETPEMPCTSKHDFANRELEDFTKTCCYLCAQNTMAIAAAMSKRTKKTDGPIKVCAQYVCRSTSDKSCSPFLDVRTVKSSVKTKTCDTSTQSAGARKYKKAKAKAKAKLKKIRIFRKLKHTKCADVRTVACGTDNVKGCSNKPRCRGIQVDS